MKIICTKLYLAHFLKFWSFFETDLPRGLQTKLYTESKTAAKKWHGFRHICLIRFLNMQYEAVLIIGADLPGGQPCTCPVGRFVRRPGGPPRQMLKSRSNALPSLQGDKGVRDKVTNREKEGVEQWRGEGPLARERGRAVLKYLCRGPRVPSYAIADEASLST